MEMEKATTSCLNRFLNLKLAAFNYTTVRLTTAEVVQLPHVCRVHNLQYIFYTSAVTFSSNLGKGDCRSIK